MFGITRLNGFSFVYRLYPNFLASLSKSFLTFSYCFSGTLITQAFLRSCSNSKAHKVVEYGFLFTIGTISSLVNKTVSYLVVSK